MGRSFRVCFTPQGDLIHVGRLQSRAEQPHPTQLSFVKITRPVIVSDNDEAVAAAEQLLKAQAEFTDFDVSPESMPLAVTSQDLRFGTFARLSKGRLDSSEAEIWQLGKALFDELDLHLPESATREVAEHISTVRRRHALSEWLSDVVAAAVENDLAKANDQNQELSRIARIFALMTGNQIERACDVATEGGDLRLATLLAQASGDDVFTADIEAQLERWRDTRADVHISTTYRKVYELLSGNVNVSKGLRGFDAAESSPDIQISNGLDWKRAFAIRFWFASQAATIAESLRMLQTDLDADTQLARPLPRHVLEQASPSWYLPDGGSVHDLAYNLLQAFRDPSISLETLLAPRSYSSSPLDYRLAWHLYQVFAKSHRNRDFIDVEDSSLSATGQQLILSYAWQLENIGLWQWAVFVLLHLETSERFVRCFYGAQSY